MTNKIFILILDGSSQRPTHQKEVMSYGKEKKAKGKEATSNEAP